MGLEFKDKEQLVESVIAEISSKIEDIDFSDGEPLRTIIEAIMQELDIQYWQVEQAYKSGFIDSSDGDDLTELVKILGINKNMAVNSKGTVKFYRETPANSDYLIPAGTLVETLPDANGNIIRFETNENVVLLKNSTSVIANISAINPGITGNVIANKIVIINNPPAGIESVINEEATTGGKEEETSEALRIRAKSALETAGLGTIPALTNRILNVEGVNSVIVNDMARGIGTVDIMVLGYISPIPTLVMNSIKDVAESSKAGGIDVKIIEPNIVTVNTEASLTLKNYGEAEATSNIVKDAIKRYFSSLKIGQPFITMQLAREILNSSDNIIDVNVFPGDNITVDGRSIIVLGTTYVDF